MQLTAFSSIAIFIAFFFADSSVAGSRFALSCPYSFLSDSILTSVCWRSNGNELTTDLDLNNCIGNHNGRLVWSGGFPGNYAMSCFSCVLNLDEESDTWELACECLDVKWKSQKTTLHLSE